MRHKHPYHHTPVFPPPFFLLPSIWARRIKCFIDSSFAVTDRCTVGVALGAVIDLHACIYVNVLAFHANSVRIFLSRCWRKRPRPLHKCGRPWTPITAPINEPCPYLYTININTPCLITAIFLNNKNKFISSSALFLLHFI